MDRQPVLDKETRALEIRRTPVLTGEDAERFVREAEENARNPQRRRLPFLLRILTE